MNINTIIEAWKISKNPTDEQIELARKRLEICTNCSSRKVLFKSITHSQVCGECGCIIIKKVFTNCYDPCPLKKWGDVDKPYFKIKTKITII